MTPQLLFAISVMVGALITYSFGVWGEKLSATIRPAYLAAFWLGLLFDSAGTEMMRRIASSGAALSGSGLHGFLGAVALILMGIHAIWATRTYLTHDPQAMRAFHRFSLTVWVIWLIPFLSGMVLANLR